MTQASSAPNPAEAYERYIAQSIFVPWTADLISRAGPRTGDRVLDLACGTGIVTRSVAPLVGTQGQVTGLDISPNMLAVARSLAPTDGPGVEWQEGSGTDLGEHTELVFRQWLGVSEGEFAELTAQGAFE